MVHSLKEEVAVSLDMKADQIGAPKPVDNFALRGTNTECLRVGPRNVPENRHAGIGPFFLHEMREQCKVIIVDEQRRMLGPGHLLQHCLREPVVYFLIVLPVRCSEDGPSVGDVAKRPKAFVCEAVVVPFLFLFCQPTTPQRIVRLFGRNAQAAVLIRRFLVGVTGTVRDPSPIAGSQDGFKCGDETAGGNEHLG